MVDEGTVSEVSLVRASMTSEASRGGEEEEVDCSGSEEGSTAVVKGDQSSDQQANATSRTDPFTHFRQILQLVRFRKYGSWRLSPNE